MLHFQIEEQVFTKLGELLFIHSDDCASVEDARCVFENMSSSLLTFIGFTFHLRQQTGGTLLCKGERLEATKMEQTSGQRAMPAWIVSYGGTFCELGNIIGM